ncbi:hypothetical protein pb186bvf_019716 [Paramecium bursaria]
MKNQEQNPLSSELQNLTQQIQQLKSKKVVLQNQMKKQSKKPQKKSRIEPFNGQSSNQEIQSLYKQFKIKDEVKDSLENYTEQGPKFWGLKIKSQKQNKQNLEELKNYLERQEFPDYVKQGWNQQLFEHLIL